MTSMILCSHISRFLAEESKALRFVALCAMEQGGSSASGVADCPYLSSQM